MTSRPSEPLDQFDDQNGRADRYPGAGLAEVKCVSKQFSELFRRGFCGS
jgi:hypothetical protein